MIVKTAAEVKALPALVADSIRFRDFGLTKVIEEFIESHELLRTALAVERENNEAMCVRLEEKWGLASQADNAADEILVLNVALEAERKANARLLAQIEEAEFAEAQRLIGVTK